MDAKNEHMTSDVSETDGRVGDASITEAFDKPPEGSAVSTVDPAALEEKIKSLEDALLRAKADLQNQQRRSAIERAEAIRFANQELMRGLVDVLDDFERTLAAAEKPENQQAVVNGIRLVHQKLLKVLSDAGLEVIDACGRTFDPRTHEALLHQPTSEVQPGVVIEQAAKGYKLRDRVIRPARVVVAKAPDTAKVEE